MYNYGYMPYMRADAMMNMPCGCYPVMEAKEEALEMMYPKIYFKMYPMVIYHCDKFIAKHGMMCDPTHKDLDDMCEDMYEKMKEYLEELAEEKEEDKCREDNEPEEELTRRRRYRRRRLVRDLGRILIIRELLGRRRPHYGYGPGFGYGPGPGFGYGPGPFGY